jgi:L-alanine-DL-glutamate epimerase-like enolase superfamily enzyme
MNIVRMALSEAVAERGIVVMVELETGTQGYGECAPLPGYSPESLSEAIAGLQAVRSRCLGLALPDAAPWNVCSLLEDLAPSLPKSALFALETACLDALSRAQQTSLSKLLGATSPRTIRRNALVNLHSGDLDGHITKLRAQGYDTFKAKVAPGILESLAQTALALRNAAGCDAELRFDANGKFSPRDAEHVLEQLTPASPSFIEEPTQGAAMLTLSCRSVPLAADESLTNDAFASRALDSDRVVAVVLKPARLGLGRARELALAARARGKRIVVSHMQDGFIGLATACEFALALGTSDACGLDPHAGLKAWPSFAIPQLETPARVCTHEGLGHGIDWSVA